MSVDVTVTVTVTANAQIDGVRWYAVTAIDPRSGMCICADGPVRNGPLQTVDTPLTSKRHYVAFRPGKIVIFTRAPGRATTHPVARLAW